MKHLHKKGFVLIGMILYSTAFLHAQCTLSGKVTNTAHTALGMADVALEQDYALVGFTQTDKKGKYLFKDIPKGNYEMTVTYIGFLSIKCPITLNAMPNRIFAWSLK